MMRNEGEKTSYNFIGPKRPTSFTLLKFKYEFKLLEIWDKVTKYLLHAIKTIISKVSRVYTLLSIYVGQFI